MFVYGFTLTSATLDKHYHRYIMLIPEICILWIPHAKMKSMAITGQFLVDCLGENELRDMLDENPLLRGYFTGYVAESKFKEYLCSHPDLSNVYKIHDLTNRTGDFSVTYKGKDYTIELKVMSKGVGEEDLLHGGVNGSVCLKRTSPEKGADDSRIYSLSRDRFDILAIAKVTDDNSWDFLFISPKYIPSSSVGPSHLITNFKVNTLNTPHLKADIIEVLSDVD